VTEQTFELESTQSSDRGQITALQYETFMKPLRAGRVAKRSQGGKELSYLEAWDVRAHLIRMFGFGNFDVETVEQHHVGTRTYENNGKDMAEVMWFAKVRLVIRDAEGREIARYSESAVGSASGQQSMAGDLHDNAIKTAASDGLKRCAINLGTQFGLSLYDNGSRTDVVKMTLVKPDGVTEEAPSSEQAERLAASVGSVTPAAAEADKQDTEAEQGGS
jgi:recombination DNA repair RAD52 pathway protein